MKWVVFAGCMLALGGLVFLVGSLIMGCGGSPFESQGAEASPAAISPVSDGGLSEDPLAGSEGGPHSPGLDAADAGEFGGGDVKPDTPSELGPPPPLPDHIADPWPADVVVEPMPAPNCFVDFAGHDSCCRAVNQPPVKCEAAQSPHFCVSCPP